MNRFLFYILFLLTISGCSTDNLPNNNNSEEESEILDYFINFNNGVSYKTSTSRAGVMETSYLPKGIVVGVYALKSIWQETNGEKWVESGVTWNVNNIQENFYNTPYESEGSSTRLFSQDGSIGQFPKEEQAALKFYAYYPYSEEIKYNPDLSIPDAPKLKITINPDMATTEDYLYTGTVDAIPEGEYTYIHLPFKHALTRLSFNLFTNDVNFTDAHCHKLTKIELITNNHQGGYMNIADGKIEPEDGENTFFEYILPEPFKILESKKGDATKTGADFLLVPGNNAINSIILYVVDEKGVEHQHTAYSYYPSMTDPKNLAAGSIHTVNVEYRSRVNFGCSIVGWEEQIPDGDFDINTDNDTQNPNFEGVEK